MAVTGATMAGVAAGGCAAAPPPSGSGTTPEQQRPTATAATASTPNAQVFDDLALLCGGTFSVDHLGPEAVERVRSRVGAATATYLEAFVPFFEACDDACLAARRPAVFLSVAAQWMPDEARDAGARLVPAYEAALARSAEDPSRSARLREELLELASFADRSAAFASTAPPPDPCWGEATDIGLGGGLAEVPDTRVTVRITNPGPDVCAIGDYALSWGGSRSSTRFASGRARCSASGAPIPPGGTAELVCVVPSRTMMGATPGMTLDNVSVVDIDATCPPVP